MSPTQVTPASRRRLALCLALGSLAAWLSYRHAQLVEPQRDFTQVWFAARAILRGENPYLMIGHGLAYDWPNLLLYPLTAAVLVTPLATLPQEWANAAFMLVGATAFAWALTRNGYGPLLGFLGAGMLVAVEMVQWSPLIAAAAVLPPLGIAFAAKPTIGAAIFAYRPSWWPIIGGLLLILLAFLALPTWFADWLDAIHRHAAMVPATPYQAPVTLPGGVIALACLTRWRRPEARLVAVLACVPQTMMPYETLPLFLVPTGWLHALLLTATSWGGLTWLVMHVSPTDYPRFLAASGPVMVLSMYVPATLLILRRPNEGPAPAWLERRIEALLVYVRKVPPYPQ